MRGVGAASKILASAAETTLQAEALTLLIRAPSAPTFSVKGRRKT